MSKSVENRPFKFGARDRREFIVGDCEVAIRAENDAMGNVIYLGRAKAGTSLAAAGWQISFQTWDATNSLTSKTWPQDSLGNASTDYQFVWNDRAGYTYS